MAEISERVASGDLPDMSLEFMTSFDSGSKEKCCGGGVAKVTRSKKDPKADVKKSKREIHHKVLVDQGN